MKDFYSKCLCHSYCLLIFLYLANSSYVSAQTLGTNYLRVRVPQIAVTDSLALDSIPIIRQSVSISYTDGLGRALQEVLVQGSPGYKDIIAPHVYDSMGRESTVYLPYSDQGTTGINSGSLRANAVQNVLNFYNPASPGAPKVATDLNPYFQTTYETSPLARVVEQGSLGSGYQVGSGHTVTSSYQVNSPIDMDVYLWTIFSGIVASRQVYKEGALTETIITDPNGHHYKEWKDLQERLISRMQVDAPNANYITSYIYNDLSQLAYMVTPGATREFIKKGSYSFVESPSDPIFMEHIYAYHYDSVSRQVEKKLPGKGWQYTIYNKQDQAVLTQDSNQRRKGQWNFIKYDAQARVIQTGIYTNSSIKTRRAMQFLCDNNPVFWEIYKPGVGYTDNAFPQLSTTSSGTTPLSVYTKVYYDDYTFSEAAAKSYQKNTLDTGYSKRTEGLVTGQSIFLLGSAGTFLTTVSYYDAENRLIQQVKDNHLGQVDTITNQYNFIGELVKSKSHTSRGVFMPIKNRTHGVLN